jgi:hypothetical protein
MVRNSVPPETLNKVVFCVDGDLSKIRDQDLPRYLPLHLVYPATPFEPVLSAGYRPTRSKLDPVPPNSDFSVKALTLINDFGREPRQDASVFHQDFHDIIQNHLRQPECLAV